jgi:cation transport ATPase
MGNLLTRTYNKVQYEISKKVSDPEADNYAKQQEAQAKQDKTVAERKAELDKQKEQKKQEDAEKKKEADELAKRSRFSPISEQIHTITKTINLYATIFVILGLGLYGGKISANQAIGYNIPFRILSFFYGLLFFFIVIPVAFIKKYLYGTKILNYTFIPLKVHVTTGWAERVLIGPYCYQEDADYFSEKARVADLYKNGYDNSLKAAAAVVLAPRGHCRQQRQQATTTDPAHFLVVSRA